jgi:hypothetical protein
MPHIHLGKRILFHPPSVEKWLMSKQTSVGVAAMEQHGAPLRHNQSEP